MTLKKKLQQVWKNKSEILEGVKNAIFTSEFILEVSKHRMDICRNCPLFDNGEDKGTCILPGTHPCCNQLKGGCGCSLNFKTMSLSSECPKGHWKALMSEQEEALLNASLNETNN